MYEKENKATGLLLLQGNKKYLSMVGALHSATTKLYLLHAHISCFVVVHAEILVL